MNNEPILKGWIWSIPFYPFISGRYRTIKDIFWYDASNELEFIVGYGKDHEILIPEILIQSPAPEIEWVRKNKEEIIRTKRLVVQVEPLMGIWSVVESNHPRRHR